MQDEGNGKEWGVKSIKSKRDDVHGNIEFLVEWDCNWADTWEPPENLKKGSGAHTCVAKPRIWVGCAERQKKKEP